MSDSQDPEMWLAERLKAHGIDIYFPGDFDALRDRLAYAIRTNRCESVIAGRRDGKPESYAQVFERVYGMKVEDVPRGAKQSTSGNKL